MSAEDDAARAAGRADASDTAAALTFGVEEEFLLVGAVDGRPSPVAGPVLEHAAAHPAHGCDEGMDGRSGTDAAEDEPGAAYKFEMLTSQVEAVTGVCTDRAGLADHLLRARQALSAAAAHSGALLLSCALPPLDGARMPHSGGARYPRIVERYGAVMSDFQCNGCHVHVGVPDRETAVAVINHLRPWLPTLLALSANSPYRDGRDTGYASWRMMEQGPFPGSGIPPYFTSAARWDAEVTRLVEVGALTDDQLTFWLARPSTRFPTVEFRVADAAATVAEAVLQATLARALVRTALAALEDGRLARPVDGQVLAAALWSAARYGLRGPAVDPWRAVRVPATSMVSVLLDEVRPALAATGDLEFVNRRLAWLAGRGTGADRQRAVVRSTGRLAAVIGHLADETLRAPESARADAEPPAAGVPEATPPPGLPRRYPAATPLPPDGGTGHPSVPDRGGPQ